MGTHALAYRYEKKHGSRKKSMCKTDFKQELFWTAARTLHSSFTVNRILSPSCLQSPPDSLKARERKSSLFLITLSCTCCPTICVAYNNSGFVFGAYTTKDYLQTNENVIDGSAFLFSMSEERPRPVRVGVNAGQPAFVDTATGPNFGALQFLHDNTANIACPGGAAYTFNADELHGNDLALTEFEAYRVEELGGILEQPWRKVQWEEK
uniref:TLDc domain-containing protein n=1 Tax=Knipowitschia caucasica TaxID=637954 RepID=A0AAV2JDV7_KNICA